MYFHLRVGLCHTRLYSTTGNLEDGLNTLELLMTPGGIAIVAS